MSTAKIQSLPPDLKKLADELLGKKFGEPEILPPKPVGFFDGLKHAAEGLSEAFGSFGGVSGSQGETGTYYAGADWGSRDGDRYEVSSLDGTHSYVSGGSRGIDTYAERITLDPWLIQDDYSFVHALRNVIDKWSQPNRMIEKIDIILDDRLASRVLSDYSRRFMESSLKIAVGVINLTVEKDDYRRMQNYIEVRGRAAWIS